jgi:hypothetical protein
MNYGEGLHLREEKLQVYTPREAAKILEIGFRFGQGDTDLQRLFLYQLGEHISVPSGIDFDFETIAELANILRSGKDELFPVKRFAAGLHAESFGGEMQGRILLYLRLLRHELTAQDREELKDNAHLYAENPELDDLRIEKLISELLKRDYYYLAQRKDEAGNPIGRPGPRKRDFSKQEPHTDIVQTESWETDKFFSNVFAYILSERSVGDHLPDKGVNNKEIQSADALFRALRNSDFGNALREGDPSLPPEVIQKFREVIRSYIQHH